MNAKCFRCGRTFETDRADAVFCDGACKAAFYREQGPSGKHVPLDKFKSKICENCGTIFWFNGYADRKGKREPRFCKDKCRKDSWVQAQRAHFEAQREAERNSRSWDAFRQRTQTPPPPPPPKQEYKGRREADNFRDRLKVPARWTVVDALIWIYGDSVERPLEAINKQCRALNRQYHPDTNGGQIYPHLSTINAAWSHLKKVLR